MNRVQQYLDRLKSLKPMRFGHYVLLIFLFSCISQQLLEAKCRANCQEKNLKLAIKLQTSLLKAVKKKQVQTFSEMLDNNFRGLNSNGQFGREKAITQFTDANLEIFGFNNPKVKREGNTLGPCCAIPRTQS